MENLPSEEILVRTAGPAFRGDDSVVTPLNVQTLSQSIQAFVKQMQTILEHTPMEISKFQLSEFTISAEVSADGQFTLLGSGVKAGASGGIEFKFKRTD